MARPGNQHCANCIGTLSFPTGFNRHCYLCGLRKYGTLLIFITPVLIYVTLLFVFPGKNPQATMVDHNPVLYTL